MAQNLTQPNDLILVKSIFVVGMYNIIRTLSILADNGFKINDQISASTTISVVIITDKSIGCFLWLNAHKLISSSIGIDIT